MAAWDLGALARAAEAQIVGGALPVSVEAVGTDTRSLPPASLFVALRGERFDGHAFVAAAVNAGARAVLVDERGSADLGAVSVPRLVVRDTLTALGDIAREVRRRIGRPLVAVTGSNGKTTTKELLYAALSARGPVHKTTGNLNNLVGLPLTMLAWPTAAWAAVLEMGMSAPGEIARLTEIAAPTVGVITNVGPAHLSGLGTVADVGRAKGELYTGLSPEATAVVNADDPVLAAVAVPLLGARKRLTFGSSRAADVRVVGQRLRGETSSVDLEVLGRPCRLTIPLVGAHNAMNAAAAVAGALALGLTAGEIQAAIGGVVVPGGRLRAVRIEAKGIHLIDDTYNANPASMQAAFLALAQLSQGRRVAVLSDMLELGPDAPALHYGVGKAAAVSGVHLVLTVGEHAAEIARGATEAGAHASHCGSLAELCQTLDRVLTAGDWVLVKGSRGMRMERVVAHLEGRSA
ncbi:MAG: UDP-N-acetylmuramoyl-tripeptide--D-alanyl-D-alanine ligase [Deltaproteobacteria bacterium]|nr:UDP-N-acetylmuramoyl-tripeptide--D-alanyl-D-alanine ligase [Deltaproteobacteria bacterium]